jgi:hypothetical protein
MAHFAELDQDSKVLRIIVIANSVLLVDNIENEEKGILFCKSLFGENTLHPLDLHMTLLKISF